MTTNPNQPPVDQAGAFLHAMFDGTPGDVQLVTIGPGGTTWRTGTLDQLAEWAAARDRAPAGVYFRVTTLTPDRSGRGRGGADDSAALVCLWADLDYGTDGHKPAPGGPPLPADAPAALALIADKPIPTILVHSGGGLYPIWKLTIPFETSAADARERAARLAAGWQQAIGRTAAAQGVAYGTGVGDLARVLRLPGTRNWKTGQPRDCTVMYDTGPTYTIEQLEAALTALEAHEAQDTTRTNTYTTDEEATVPAEVSATETVDRFSLLPSAGPAPDVFDVLDETADWLDVLPAGWTEVRPPDRDCVRAFRRPGATSAVSAKVLQQNPHVLVVHSEDAGMPSGAGQRLTKGRVYAHTWHGGDESAAARGILYGTSPGCASLPPAALAALRGHVPTGGAATPVLGQPATAAMPSGVAAEADAAGLWDTNRLRHIRQAAHARLLSGPALLAAVLARILAETPANIVLPPTIGGPASLNFAVATVGGSGDGKSALYATSRELLGDVGNRQRHIERALGSGEGLAQTFLVWDKDLGENQLIGDPRRIIIIDEVDSLGAGQKRNGATIGPVLRSALTGGILGQENATADRRRFVPAGTYRLAMLIGVQPTRAGALLDDADAGTPQRLLWVPTADATVPDSDTAWPGPVYWRPPAITDVIGYPDHIRAEVRAARLDRLQGRDTDPLAGHLLLLRLKVAAALAVLHEQTSITDQWWRLAGILVDMSTAMQAGCLRILADEHDRAQLAAGRGEALRRQGVAQAVDERAQKAARSIWRKVAGHAAGSKNGNDQKHEPGEGCTERCVSRALRNFPDRAELRDPAIEHAELAGWIEGHGGRFWPGPSRPADT